MQASSANSNPSDASVQTDAPVILGRSLDASASVDATTYVGADLPSGKPADVGLNLASLLSMTDWVANNPKVAIFSLLLSRHGTLAYELYTPGIERDEAQFMMSTSKTFTSAIVGTALDRGLLPGTDTSIADLLPARLFSNSADVTRLRGVTLKDVMGMQALDADEPPRDTSAAGVALGNAFASATNRVEFALKQPLLATPGVSYQYNDVNPMLAGGAVQYATGKRLFDFATETMFTPMAFQNAEWVGQDPDGIDLASYGLRIRPMDMQKFGVLFLNHGVWNGQQLISQNWIDTSWTAYVNTGDGVTPGYEDYGWFWWHRSDWGAEVHWTNGWRGQFIVVIPAYDAVFSMSADIETGDELTELDNLMTQYVMPALTTGVGDSASMESSLAAAIAAANQGASRVKPSGDPRMIPSVAAQSTPIPFNPNAN